MKQWQNNQNLQSWILVIFCLILDCCQLKQIFKTYFSVSSAKATNDRWNKKKKKQHNLKFRLRRDVVENLQCCSISQSSSHAQALFPHLSSQWNWVTSSSGTVAMLWHSHTAAHPCANWCSAWFDLNASVGWDVFQSAVIKQGFNDNSNLKLNTNGWKFYRVLSSNQ